MMVFKMKMINVLLEQVNQLILDILQIDLVIYCYFLEGIGIVMQNIEMKILGYVMSFVYVMVRGEEVGDKLFMLEDVIMMKLCDLEVWELLNRE